MIQNDTHHIHNFRVAGINYKKTDASIRSMFSINADQYATLLQKAPQYGVKEFFIVSTCNRTEIYGVANSCQQLVNLLCEETAGDKNLFSDIAYQKSGTHAIEHIYHVAAGLDSQILGDYEILGQIKNAVKPAKEAGYLGAFTERLVNCVIQSSKAVKTQTSLSGGTVSVSFAAVQYIKQHITDISSKNILLIGTGKIGKSTCRNLIDYLGTKKITLVNRTFDTAEALADELGISCAPYNELAEQVKKSDIILVSTNAATPIILAKDLENCGNKLVIDLSIPYNVDPNAGSLDNIDLVNVDVLSKIKDETLQARQNEVPKAIEIIDEHIKDFKDWCAMRKYVPVLKEVKSKLKTIQLPHAEPTNKITDNSIQEVINMLATKMRKDYTPGCHYIQAINEYIAQHD